MKRLGLLLVIISFQSRAEICLPDASSTQSFNENEALAADETVTNFENRVSPELPRPIKIMVNLEYLNPKVNAEIIKENDLLKITVMGGMLSHREMSQQTLSLLLCHELGHFMGGPPLKSRTGWSSTEGQADYYSTYSCVKKFKMSEAEFMDASLALATIYAEARMEALPHLNSCDNTVVDRINFGYPSAQCRLDTLIAGWNKQERPRCWFKD